MSADDGFKMRGSNVKGSRMRRSFSAFGLLPGCLSRILAMLSLLLSASATPAGAQAPPYQLQWGGLGAGPGQLNEPWGIAVDPTERFVYVADRGNHRIQKFTADGAFVTQWGSQGSGPGQFVGPDALAVDGAGNVYVADHDSRLVQKFDPTGTYLGQWTTVVRAVAADFNHVYVTDDFNGLVKVFDPDGDLAQSLSTHVGSDNQFPGPWGIAVNPLGGAIYFADFGNARIKTIVNGTVANLTGGLSGWDLLWLACDEGNHIYTVTSFDGGGTVVVYGPSSGIPLYGWGSNGSGPGQFNRPRGISVDSHSHVYIADSGNNRIQRFGFGPTPARTTTWGRLKRAFR